VIMYCLYTQRPCQCSEKEYVLAWQPDQDKHCFYVGGYLHDEEVSITISGGGSPPCSCFKGVAGSQWPP
jgi:hypothetical protein